ncbi:MAG: LysM peptidoglycan-binding domain-containing protein [Alicyclobacillus sp.]|nr:LysM peptidoglycan-binding domain-containing protein [Alicyclobacillus sp.]
MRDAVAVHGARFAGTCLGAYSGQVCVKRSASGRTAEGRHRGRSAWHSGVKAASLGAMLALAAISLSVHQWLSARHLAETPTSAVRYVVQPGDTLWEIAERVGGAHVGTPEEVSAIMRENHLTQANIWPGEVLWVPQVHGAV